MSNNKKPNQPAPQPNQVPVAPNPAPKTEPEKKGLFGLTRSERITAITTLVAAFISLLVLFGDKWIDQRKDDQEAFDKNENKLRYLQLVSNSSYRIFSDYDLAVRNMHASFKQDPFYIPDLPNFPPS